MSFALEPIEPEMTQVRGDMGTPIIFDNDDDNTDSAKALPAMYEALRVLRGIGGQS